MSYTYGDGFIGAGNMGGALARAASQAVGGAPIAVSCSTPDSTAAAVERPGCAAETPERIQRESCFVFPGIKPQMIAGVTHQLAAPIRESGTVSVSMLAGVSLERLGQLLGPEKKIIRIMPNTPCAVGEGMIPLCRSVCFDAVEAAYQKAKQLG